MITLQSSRFHEVTLARHSSHFRNHPTQLEKRSFVSVTVMDSRRRSSPQERRRDPNPRASLSDFFYASSLRCGFECRVLESVSRPQRMVLVKEEKESHEKEVLFE